MPTSETDGHEDRLARPPGTAGRRGPAAPGELRLAPALPRRQPPRDLRRRPEGVGRGPLGRRPRDREGEPADLHAGPRSLPDLVSGRLAPRSSRPTAPASSTSWRPVLERRRQRARALRVAHELEGPSELGRWPDCLRNGREGDRFRHLAARLRPPRGASRPPSAHAGERERPADLTRRPLARLRVERVRSRGDLRRLASGREDEVPGDDRRGTPPGMGPARAGALLHDARVLDRYPSGHPRRISLVRSSRDALPAAPPQLGDREPTRRSSTSPPTAAVSSSWCRRTRGARRSSW